MRKNLYKKFIFLSILCFSSFLEAQSNLVTGSITDALGPVAGANVLVKGTTRGAVSDFDGNYEIAVDTGDVLVFSYVGYLTQEIIYTGQDSINVKMREDAALLNEVVVLGYGKTVKKEDLTGAVSVVGAKELEKSPLINVDQALQGRASGVQLTQSSGAPGAGLKIRIRGTNSINGSNAPLIVVDGLIGVDINSVNPNDIASLSVLKDASSTAVYGNQGANGVIIITTKKGAPGKAVIEFGSFISFAEASNRIDLLSPAEFIEFANIKNQAATGELISGFNTQEQIDNFIANSVDYQDEVFRNAVARNYELSLRGGSENINYFVSGGYLDQEGIAINTNFERYSLRANVNADLNDRLSLSSSLNLIRQEGYNNDPAFGANLALGAIGFYPITPIFDDQGNYNIQNVDIGAGTPVLINPIFLANESVGESFTNRSQANVQLNYKVIDHLSFNLSGGVDYSNVSVGIFNPEGSTLGQPNNAEQRTSNGLNWQYAARLTYENVIDEKHDIQASIIGEQRKIQNKSFNALGRDLFTPSVGYDNLSIASQQLIGSGYDERKLRSAIGRVAYNYDSRYLITGSIRYDQTSVFLNDQEGIFPSFALGWNINNEDFFDSEAISTLRLRGGWGETGNQNINSNAALNLLNNNPWIPNGGNVGSTAILPGSTLANPDLSWETTVQTNIGLDLGLLNNRFNLSFEYFVKNTTDLLFNRLVPQFTGRTNQFVNAGEVQNRGFDLTIDGRIIQNEDFNWNISANISAYKNEIVELLDGETEIFPALQVGAGIPAPAIVRVGAPIGSFYGSVFEGIDATNGSAIYAEEDDIIGDPNPDFIFGINNNLSYKGFDLNVFIQGVQGNDVFNYSRALISGLDNRIPFGTSAFIREQWRPNNTNSSVPSINTRLASSEQVEDGSFIRLKNVSLGYTLSDSKALSAIGAESLRIYVSGQNLVTITDYTGLDPEVSNGGENDQLAGVDIGALPTPKSFTLGLNFKF